MAINFQAKTGGFVDYDQENISKKQIQCFESLIYIYYVVLFLSQNTAKFGLTEDQLKMKKNGGKVTPDVFKVSMCPTTLITTANSMPYIAYWRFCEH